MSGKVRFVDKRCRWMPPNTSHGSLTTPTLVIGEETYNRIVPGPANFAAG